MTKDDIIRMAQEAGIGVKKDLEDWHVPVWHLGVDYLVRFAALVRADEREACARVCEEMHLLHFAGPWKKQAAAIRARSKK
jgi:hypothetical protein